MAPHRRRGCRRRGTTRCGGQTWRRLRGLRSGRLAGVDTPATDASDGVVGFSPGADLDIPRGAVARQRRRIDRGRHGGAWVQRIGIGGLWRALGMDGGANGQACRQGKPEVSISVHQVLAWTHRRRRPQRSDGRRSRRKLSRLRPVTAACWPHVNGEAAGSSGEDGAGWAVDAARHEGNDFRCRKQRDMRPDGLRRNPNNGRRQGDRRTAVCAGAAGVVVGKGRRTQRRVRCTAGVRLGTRFGGGVGVLMRGRVVRQILPVGRHSGRRSNLHQLVNRAAVLHGGCGDRLDGHRQNQKPDQQ